MNEEPYKNREIDEKFNDALKAVKTLRYELLDDNFGILPKMLIQTTKHNGRMQKVERILLIVGTATGVLLITNGSELITFLKGII